MINCTIITFGSDLSNLMLAFLFVKLKALRNFLKEIVLIRVLGVKIFSV